MQGQTRLRASTTTVSPLLSRVEGFARMYLRTAWTTMPLVTSSPEQLHRFSEDSGDVLFNYLQARLLRA